MPLTTGQTITYYEILGPLGAGGMGEVYRARDTRLEREVALKILPDELSHDEERLRRFDREAKTLASFNHPNVAQVFGIDQVGDTCLIAMELVGGEDLSERLKRGALPFDETVDVCRQIAAGLEAAHEAGVVHRDLKPANVRVTPDGAVKVLDFGLAKLIPSAAGSGSAAGSAAGATTAAESDSFLLTEEGLVLGTPTYMSPEQARGKPVDRRTDIWAFGCVLFECLTGRRAFGGESVTDVLAAILEREPAWELLPASTTPRVTELLRRTLHKDPRQRLRDIGEARIVLESPDRGGESEPTTPGVRTARAATARGGLAWIVAAVAMVIAIGLLARDVLRDDPTTAGAPMLSYTLDHALAATGTWGGNLVAVSPDGRLIAYVGVPGDTRVFLRPMDAFTSTPVPGSESARCPFLSPDGRQVGYWSEGALHKATVDGGPSTLIAAIDTINAATWGPDDRIVVAETVGGLLAVDARSGEVTLLTESAGRLFHDAPDFLPDGETLLVEEQSELALVRADGTSRTFGIPGQDPRWSSSGHVVFQRDDHTLWAVTFDPVAREVTGEPFLVRADPVVDFDLSDDGTLVFVSGTPLPDGELVWVDRSGTASSLDFGMQRFLVPRLSPDGNTIAVSIAEPGGGRTDLWLLDVRRGSRTRLTTRGEWSLWPVWTHGASRICFMQAGAMHWKPADGSGAPRRALEGDSVYDVPISWSEDQQALAYYDYGQVGDLKIWHADGEVEEFLVTEFDERSPHFSPDGRWIAYVSNQSGTDEVYVRPYARGAGPGARLSISSGGGIEPRWSRDGREITYRNGTQMFAVAFEPGSPPTASTPQLLFDEPYRRSTVGRGNPNYDVAEDGRFLMIRGPEDEVVPRVHVVRGWSPR